MPQQDAKAADVEYAIFAGGCFWCLEPVFDQIDGVVSTEVGYSGGHTKNPTYSDIGTGRSGHAEVIRIGFDPAKVEYRTLVDLFWRNIDPFDSYGQFCDKGDQYRTEIFYTSEVQKSEAEASKQAFLDEKRFDQPIVTKITQASTFYPAEDYHQEFYKKNPLRYQSYKYGCGRDRRLEEIWGD